MAERRPTALPCWENVQNEKKSKKEKIKLLTVALQFSSLQWTHDRKMGRRRKKVITTNEKRTDFFTVNNLNEALNSKNRNTNTKIAAWKKSQRKNEWRSAAVAFSVRISYSSLFSPIMTSNTEHVVKPLIHITRLLATCKDKEVAEQRARI